MIIIFLGEEKHKGVAVILDEEVAKSCKGFWAAPPGILVVKLQARRRNRLVL